MGAAPFTASFNIAGNPAANVPCGFSSDGLPIGAAGGGEVGGRDDGAEGLGGFGTGSALGGMHSRDCEELAGDGILT